MLAYLRIFQWCLLVVFAPVFAMEQVPSRSASAQAIVCIDKLPCTPEGALLCIPCANCLLGENFFDHTCQITPLRKGGNSRVVYKLQQGDKSCVLKFLYGTHTVENINDICSALQCGVAQYLPDSVVKSYGFIAGKEQGSPDAQLAVVEVMECVNGKSLHELMRDSSYNSDSLSNAWKALADILVGLHMSTLNEKMQAVVHGDCNPTNIFLRSESIVFIDLYSLGYHGNDSQDYFMLDLMPLLYSDMCVQGGMLNMGNSLFNRYCLCLTKFVKRYTERLSGNRLKDEVQSHLRNLFNVWHETFLRVLGSLNDSASWQRMYTTQIENEMNNLVEWLFKQRSSKDWYRAIIVFTFERFIQKLNDFFESNKDESDYSLRLQSLKHREKIMYQALMQGF